MSAIGNIRQILTFWLFAVFLILFLFPLTPVGADSDFEILPYVQNVNQTSAAILWKSVDQMTGSVEYGPTTAYRASADGRIKYVIKNGLPQPEEGSVIRAQLDNLVADTVYHYRVMLSSSTSQDRTFRTAPADANATFTFLVYGDSRNDPEMHAQVASASVTGCQPAFVLHAGDLVPSSGVGKSVWTRQFFKPAGPLLKVTWFAVTRGNHENMSGLFSLFFEGTGNSQDKDYYSFDWGSVHVVTLNTNNDYEPGSEQYQFLERDLAGTSRPFKVFLGHHPAYSSGFHGSTKNMQEHLQPLFERYGVQLVLAGHDHDYERTIVNGITYVVSGGGGAPLYAQKHLKQNSTSVVFRKAYNFVQVDVVSGAMTLTAWAVDNHGTMTIVDGAVIKP
jgi:predicted phosphodiesterase